MTALANNFFYQCPYQYGPAVYHARAYLKACGDSTVYQNDCEIVKPATSGSRLVNTNENALQQFAVGVNPNPAKDEVIISIPAEINGNYKVELFSLLGKIMISEKFNENIHSLPMNHPEAEPRGIRAFAKHFL